MLLAIISDIHGNTHALRSSLQKCDELGVDEIMCLGDVVGYGGNPNKCCELLRERCDVVLMGNHDAAVVGVMDTDYYYDAAKKALFWTRNQLDDDNFKWLYSLPYTHVNQEIDSAFFHAAPILPSAFYYVVRNEEAQALTRMKTGLLSHNFIGHSHLTTTYAYRNNKVEDVTGRYQLKADTKYLVNVGSVGQPRDRNPDSCFVLFDTETRQMAHIRNSYDIAAAAARIRQVGLDEKFARRLALGV
ncbi:MAG: metallophosphoesterase [Myxococcales bacterium]|nr:metallophosphoesterase [Myxococcales bacterium]